MQQHCPCKQSRNRQRKNGDAHHQPRAWRLPGKGMVGPHHKSQRKKDYASVEWPRAQGTAGPHPSHSTHESISP
eukprot:1140771-Pelagomonas_calceolata.AAC.19